MKLLFLCSQETDYLQDLTFSGLVEVLGNDAVVDYPWHWQYHREKRFFWSRRLEYPRNLGMVDSLLTTTPHPTLSPEGRGDNGRALFPDQHTVKRMLSKKEFDIVIMGSAKPDVLNTFERIFEWIRVPWIFIDGGDWSEIGGDFKRLGGDPCLQSFQMLCKLKKPLAIFKRELALGSGHDSVFPLQFSAALSKIGPMEPSRNKKYQVLFLAVESSGIRKEVFRLLKGKYDCDKNGSCSGQTYRKYPLRGPNYFKALNEAKIVLSFRGEGFDTLRYWETPACASLLISEKPLIEIPENFKDRRQAVFCKNDLSDLLSLIDYYLSHEDESREMALSGQRHLRDHHTPRHRAEFVLGTVQELRH